MKKSLIILTSICLLGSSFAHAGEIERLDKKTVKSMTAIEMQDRAEILEVRLLEIEAIDLTELDRSERKSLKKELRYINREMTALGNGGIYLSTGAVIIILLLLILIL